MLQKDISIQTAMPAGIFLGRRTVYGIFRSSTSFLFLSSISSCTWHPKKNMKKKHTKSGSLLACSLIIETTFLSAFLKSPYTLLAFSSPKWELTMSVRYISSTAKCPRTFNEMFPIINCLSKVLIIIPVIMTYLCSCDCSYSLFPRWKAFHDCLLCCLQIIINMV